LTQREYRAYVRLVGGDKLAAQIFASTIREAAETLRKKLDRRHEGFLIKEWL